MEKERTLISLDQIETGSELKLTLQELLDKVKDINPDDFRLLVDKIGFEDLDTELYKLILSKSEYNDSEIKNRLQVLEELKANRSELLDYRRLDVDITEEDLEKELRDKINVLYEKGYDDRWVVEAVQRLERVKLNRYEAEYFRRIDQTIGLDDLDSQLHDLLYDIQTIVDEVTILQETSVSKEYVLENFRRKVIDINYDDLSSELQERLNVYSTTSVMIEDKFNILDNMVTNLMDIIREKADLVDLSLKADKSEVALKADKTYVDENFRRKDEKLDIEDLAPDISDKINNISPEFNSEIVLNAIKELKLNKADKSYLDNFLRKTEPISESDLDEHLVEKINLAAQKYDDRNLISYIKDLQKSKVDIRDLINFRRKETKIELDDLSSEIQIILNSHEDNNAEHKSIIATLRDLQDNKVSSAEANDTFIRKDGIINLDNLSEEIISKFHELNAVNREQELLINKLNNKISKQNEIITALEGRIRFNELEIEQIKEKISKN